MKFIVDIQFPREDMLDPEPIRSGLQDALVRTYGFPATAHHLEQYNQADSGYVCTCHPFILADSDETHLPECPAHNYNTCKSCVHYRKVMGI